MARKDRFLHATSGSKELHSLDESVISNSCGKFCLSMPTALTPGKLQPACNSAREDSSFAMR
jgi:hypothetical protein